MTAAPAVNPFVGLRPFEAEESLLFFGRHQQTGELLRRLHDSRFLAVVGSSGCGKSSLVRAGLIPVLQAGFLAEDRDVWHIGKMKPGDAPIANLADSLLACARTVKPSPNEVDEWVQAIREGGIEGVLHGLAGLMTNQDSNLLVLVDQFEEVFRFDYYSRAGSGREEASDFVSIMLDLAAQREMPIYVVMTMRSDFLGDCDVFHSLPEALNRSQYLVPRLSREQRREAIEGPIKLYRQEIASRLTDRLLNETIDTRDDLPVLQHALMRTWDNWQHNGHGPIDIGHYEQIGTIHKALSKDADAAMEGMNDRQLLLTKRLFQALTTVDSGNRGIRRPAKLNDVEARSGTEPEEIWPIVTRFRSDGRSFLIVSTEDARANPLIDISHESLIRQWTLLGNWVQEEAESIKVYQRLAESERLHRKRKSGLYSDPELQVALDWQVKESPNLAWAKDQPGNFEAAMAFLRESQRVRDSRLAEVEFERRWRRPRVVIGVVILALFFFDLGLDSVSDFWKRNSEFFSELGSAIAKSDIAKDLPLDVSDENQDRTIADAMAQMFRFSVHLGLFLGLTFCGKGIYRTFAFQSISEAVAGVTSQAASPRVKIMRKLIHTMLRIGEKITKWASILAGISILGTCSVAGLTGDFGWEYVLIGFVTAALLVGWVFAVARLNSEVKAIRAQLEQNRKPGA